jgi:C1A family cysteine protease
MHGVSTKAPSFVMNGRARITKGLRYWGPNDQAIKPNNASPAMKISGYKQVDSISDAILQLKAGSPVVVSISLSKDFFYPENGMITLPANPIVEGMGTICPVGYNQETKMFKFAQSWGTGWGDSGFGHISENDLKAVWGQGFVINVSSK